MRKRFQRGQLWLRKASRREADAWYLRYRDEASQKRAHVVGFKLDLPTKADARKAADEFLEPLNAGRRRIGPATVADLIAKYRRDEAPSRLSTGASYKSLLTCWIEPRWGSLLLSDVRAVDVEAWLKGLERPAKADGVPARPLATKTKSNIRQLMHVLFECGRRWELCEENPITLVRQSAKHSRALAKLSVAQYQQLEAAMVEPYRTIVLIAGCLGLRIGEIVGLQWGDFDAAASTLHIQRDIYQGQVDDLKSHKADRFMPLPPVVKESLETWRANANYQADDEYIFSQDNGRAVKREDGTIQASKPMWADTLLESILQPVAVRLGIGKIGWHAFRHLYASLLQAAGAENVVAKELMGHADYRTTESYMYALDDRKRAASDAVAALLKPRLQ